MRILSLGLVLATVAASTLFGLGAPAQEGAHGTIPSAAATEAAAALIKRGEYVARLGDSIAKRPVDAR
jgi:hypothetical protein